MWRKEIKIKKEVGKDQNCGEGWNSRMRRENNKIVEEGMRKLRRENNKIVDEGIKKLRRETLCKKKIAWFL